MYKKKILKESSAGIQGRDEPGCPARPRELSDICCSHLDRIDELSAKLKVASSEIVSKEKEIAKLKEPLDEKENLVRQIAKDNRNLQRKLRSDSGKFIVIVQLGTKLNTTLFLFKK